MPQSIEDFRAGLLGFAERCQRFREHIKNEEATKVALILPFIALLGYDDRDPTEVAPEHSADFSDKYKNRVDYAVMRAGQPVIAVECKPLGNVRKDDRGQLKSYFNAVKTIKVGVLTEGVVYEFFVDSQEPNMMDDEPFLTIDFDQVAKGHLSASTVETLAQLRKGHFDPEVIGDNAQRGITHRTLVDYLAMQFSSPSLEFTRFLLKENDIKHVRAAAMESFAALVKGAFDEVFAANVLAKLDIPSPGPKPAPSAPTATFETPPVPDRGIVTTATEVAAFQAICRRLAFLAAGDPNLFDAIQTVSYRDYAGKMVVYYGQERKGRLLDILEHRDGTIRFVLADGAEPSLFNDLSEVDQRLLALFKRRISEVRG